MWRRQTEELLLVLAGKISDHSPLLEHDEMRGGLWKQGYRMWKAWASHTGRDSDDDERDTRAHIREICCPSENPDKDGAGSSKSSSTASACLPAHGCAVVGTHAHTNTASTGACAVQRQPAGLTVVVSQDVFRP
jgi:hypothetical protein